MIINRSWLTLVILFTLTAGAFAGESRGRLGVYLVTLDEAGPELSYEGEGVMISGVVPESGADKAGLEKGDIIIALNGMDVAGSKDVIRLLETTKPGDEVTVAYFRDGATQDATVVLGEKSIFKWHMPKGKKWVFTTGEPHAYIGVEMKDLNEQLAEYFEVKSGILIAKVASDSPAAASGLKAGDVITSFAGQAVEGTRDLYKLLGDFDEGQKVMMGVVRKGKNKDFQVTLGAREDHPSVFHFHGGDEDAVIVRPPHMKKLIVPGEDLDIRIPEIEIHDMMRSFHDMEDVQQEMEALRKELDELRKELKAAEESE